MLDRLGELVTELGDSLLRWRDRAIGGEWQGSQLKTVADREAHQELSLALRGLINVPVVSEEDESSHANVRHERYWLIDPIDGTASLAGGFPGFVMQAALMQDGEPVLAAIRAPVHGYLYLAERGGGAMRNGDRITVDSEPTQRILLIDNYPTPRGTAAVLMDELPCTGYVESGSISLKICRIADGTADVFFKDVVVRDWDIAAPYLVLNEAMGSIKRCDGKSYEFTGAMEKPGIVAARTPALTDRLVSFLSVRDTTQQ